MANVIIHPWHQSAPNEKFDLTLAREAAEFKKPGSGSAEDWDAIRWEAAHPDVIRRRQAMKNRSFDSEFDRPEHHDPGLRGLQQRAYREWVELRPNQWVEENLRLYEANCEKARKHHMPGQERFQGKETEKERLTNILHPSAVMRKLRMAGVDARDEEHPQARIWLNDFTVHGLVGVNVWIPPQEMEEEGYLLMLKEAKNQHQRDYLTDNFYACRERRKIRRTITSLQEPYGPEWSLMHFDQHGVATKEKYRGWRTAMLVLILAEILTEAEVDAAFGPPLGEAANFYRQQLQNFRTYKARA